MQLTGPEILRRMQQPNPNNQNNSPDIIIKPFDSKCLGSNSYDLHLGNTLGVYTTTVPYGMRPAIKYIPGRKYDMRDWFLNEDFYFDYLKNPQKYDIRNPQYLLNPCNQKSNEITMFKIPTKGLILSPNIGYLGTTLEYTETHNLFPYIDGKSSVGRNFISIHETAGRGDDGFCGQWTLEITVKYATVVYPNMRIGQIYYEEFTGERKPYNVNPNSHYRGQFGPTAAAPIPVEHIR